MSDISKVGLDKELAKKISELHARRVKKEQKEGENASPFAQAPDTITLSGETSNVEAKSSDEESEKIGKWVEMLKEMPDTRPDALTQAEESMRNGYSDDSALRAVLDGLKSGE